LRASPPFSPPAHRSRGARASQSIS
jgi:hypothetical protein